MLHVFWHCAQITLPDSGLATQLIQKSEVWCAGDNRFVITRMEHDDGIHSHCSSCFLMTCNHAECPVVPCINGCGTKYHKCKEEDHLQEICSEQEVACINNQYGCPDTILRRQQGQHLSVCPASIVICTHTWNRWPLSCRRYNQLQYFNHGQDNFA